MSVMDYIQAEHRKDVNIEINTLRGIPDIIRCATAGKQNIEVLLVSSRFKAKQIFDAINIEWHKDFYTYLQTNHINLSDIICVTPYDDVTIEDPKAIGIKQLH